jgi:hypothetical protein
MGVVYPPFLAPVPPNPGVMMFAPQAQPPQQSTGPDAGTYCDFYYVPWCSNCTGALDSIRQAATRSVRWQGWDYLQVAGTWICPINAATLPVSDRPTRVPTFFYFRDHRYTGSFIRGFDPSNPEPWLTAIVGRQENASPEQRSRGVSAYQSLAWSIQTQTSQSSYSQPSYTQRSYTQPSYTQAAYSQPSYTQYSYSQPAYYSQSSFTQPAQYAQACGCGG